MSAPKSFDFVIVGGGTAGLVLASRLTEDPNVQVLVIEAGKDLTTDTRVKTPSMSSALIETDADWNLKTIPQSGLGGRRTKIPLGRMLGGSSAINTLIFTPIAKSNIDAWADLGNPGWDYASFSKSMSKVYNLPNSPWKTDGHGPLSISIPTEDNGWSQAWRDTIATLGYPTSMNPFTGEYYGAIMSPEAVQASSKQRSYVGSAYLQPALTGTNLTIWTETMVDKVLFDTKTIIENSDVLATGVQFTKNGEIGIVSACKEIIISAGTYHSPKVLELSGIGDAKLLQRLGIEVVVDNPHVGENLQTHPYCTMTSEAIEDKDYQTIDDLIRQEPSAIAAAAKKYEENEGGPFSRSGLNATAQLPLPSNFLTADGTSELDRIFKECCGKAELGKTTPAFAKAHESYVHSVLSSKTEASALYYSFAGYAMLEGEGGFAPIPAGVKNWFTGATLLAHPLSRGSTHITSNSSSSPDLAVDPKFLSHPFDVELLSRHLQQLHAIFKTEPLASYLVEGGKHLPSNVNLFNMDEVRDYVHKKAVSAHHHSGTCSMMPREIGGVVNEHLKVYGCKNLRVCDFSIAPIIPRCNPQATVYGIAEHGASIIKSTS
ncbi:hypothetical protein F4813DRAFT_255808 [Daldinia decipiens]|uniref:uncharacterized protein n=1 Tax=Daldinia decipiens TaxID=326647 RepID=UPI0020C1E89D|nr:uncharacterized protein F4813DRAFT_255808 [Daldinia decipiens]KAI1653386.1 hypothetical protein F4813DRAFT_255808 [Daldinia decipiens]